jgi:endonuclease YncB( thermonuclease family)
VNMGRIIGVIAVLLAWANVCVAGYYVIDGDTIVVDKKTFRINGIDAPEAGQKCTSERGRQWGCGDAATNVLYELTRLGDVRCERIETDKYGRFVGTCFAGDVDLGQAMVERGMAWAFVRYSDVYAPSERIAKRAKIGIWRGPSVPAWEYRSKRWKTATNTAPKGCAIKGNISSGGKIYHTPWSKWYAKTGINTAKGERWFCNEAEAVAAGWRAAR